MPHDHGHSHAHSHSSAQSSVQSSVAHKNIGFAFFLNFSFALLEFIGAVYTGSVAVLANAIHDASDAAALGISFFLEKYSGRKPDERFSYGYKRFSLLSAFFTGVGMLFATLFVLVEIAHRFRNSSEHHPYGLGILSLAMLGIFMNGLAAFKLSRGKTQNEKILTWHLFEDMMGLALLILGGLLIEYKSWPWVDPMMGLFLSLFVLWNVFKNLKETSKLFLQARPLDFREDEFRKRVLELPGVENIHDLHVWSLDGHQNILSLHIVLSPDAYAHSARVKRRVAEMAHAQSKSHAKYHLTIETELRDEECRESC